MEAAGLSEPEALHPPVDLILITTQGMARRRYQPSAQLRRMLRAGA
jgi:hypothetical protein